MHSTHISIPRAPHNFTLTCIHSQLSSFAYSTKLIYIYAHTYIYINLVLDKYVLGIYHLQLLPIYVYDIYVKSTNGVRYIKYISSGLG